MEYGDITAFNKKVLEPYINPMEEDSTSQDNQLLKGISSRLGIDSKGEANLIKFADTVAQIESNRDTQAKNDTTSATGAFQFVKGSVLPAINRMERAGELPDWAKSFKEVYSGDVSKELHRDMMSSLSYEQQRDMFLADISQKTIGQPGYGDTLLKGVALGNPASMRELYYKGHHTAPDEATIARTEKFFL